MVCSLWLIYRFIKAFFCVQGASSDQENEQAALKGKSGRVGLEEEMDVTQPNVSFFGSGGVAEEARNGI
jgi:hypothetical protein